MNMPTRTLTRKVGLSPRWASLDRYLVAPYASTEQHFQSMLIVDPALTEPTWLLRAGSRKATRRNILALVVPSLDMFTLDMSRTLTHVATDYIGIRKCPAKEGLIKSASNYPGDLALITTKVTADGPVLHPLAV